MGGADVGCEVLAEVCVGRVLAEVLDAVEFVEDVAFDVVGETVPVVPWLELLSTAGPPVSGSPHAAASKATNGTVETIRGEKFPKLDEMSERRNMAPTQCLTANRSAKQ